MWAHCLIALDLKQRRRQAHPLVQIACRPFVRIARRREGGGGGGFAALRLHIFDSLLPSRTTMLPLVCVYSSGTAVSSRFSSSGLSFVFLASGITTGTTPMSRLPAHAGCVSSEGRVGGHCSKNYFEMLSV